MINLTLYEASVLTYLQTLDAVSGFLAKSLTHLADSGIDPETLVAASLYADMRPLGFQVQNTAFHSLGAVEAMLAGALTMPGRRPDLDYAGLQAVIDNARSGLRQIDPEQLNARSGQELVFAVPDRPTRVFTTEGFLLSFSLPNFHFHATTAYDILRANGVPLGKRDYLGELRLKG
ncbi:MAG: hypothetical protein JWM33_1028 [Caulobacteraceae bacterium]|nr:hypothetical protein [Caulobacteraceae bacterium]